MLSVKQRGFKYHFGIFGLTQSEIETQSPRLLVNSQTIMPNVYWLKILRFAFCYNESKHDFEKI